MITASVTSLVGATKPSGKVGSHLRVRRCSSTSSLTRLTGYRSEYTDDSSDDEGIEIASEICLEVKECGKELVPAPQSVPLLLRMHMWMFQHSREKERRGKEKEVALQMSVSAPSAPFSDVPREIETGKVGSSTKTNAEFPEQLQQLVDERVASHPQTGNCQKTGSHQQTSGQRQRKRHHQTGNYHQKGSQYQAGSHQQPSDLQAGSHQQPSNLQAGNDQKAGSHKQEVSLGHQSPILQFKSEDRDDAFWCGIDNGHNVPLRPKPPLQRKTRKKTAPSSKKPEPEADEHHESHKEWRLSDQVMDDREKIGKKDLSAHKTHNPIAHRSVHGSNNKGRTKPQQVQEHSTPYDKDRSTDDQGLGKNGRNPWSHNVPAYYVAPRANSNKKLIRNAISCVCLAGSANIDKRVEAIQELDKNGGNHCLILFKDSTGSIKFKALYNYYPEENEARRIYGAGPKIVSSDMAAKFYKYNSGKKDFEEVITKTMSIRISGFTLKPSYPKK